MQRTRHSMLQFLIVVLLPLVCKGARVADLHQDNASREQVGNLPPIVVEFINSMASRQCTYKLAAEYERVFSVGDTEQLQGQRPWQWSFLLPFTSLGNTTVQTEADLIDASVSEDEAASIDVTKYSLCQAGSSFLSCAKSLPLSIWLQQRWELEDAVKANSDPWYSLFGKKRRSSGFDFKGVKAKKEFYNQAAKATGFSASRALKYCREQQEKPDLEDVRSCVLEDAQEAGLPDLVKAQWDVEDRLLMIDILTNYRHSFHNMGHIGDLKKQRKQFLKSRKAAFPGFALERKIAACQKVLSQSMKMRMTKRAMSEVMSVCDKDAGCTERGGSFCPAGFGCQCERAYTPDLSAKAAFWFTAVGMPLTWVVGGAAGLISAGPGGVLPGAQIAAMMVPDPLYPLLGAALFAKKWFPECMCFPQICKYNKEEGHCSMEVRGGMKTSSNPLGFLPPEGLKCALEGDEATSCQLTMCAPVDISVQGQADHLYGRVGRHGRSVYNCASTTGTQDGLLSALEQLPSVTDKESVPNIPENRNDILRLLLKQ